MGEGRGHADVRGANKRRSRGFQRNSPQPSNAIRRRGMPINDTNKSYMNRIGEGKRETMGAGDRAWAKNCLTGQRTWTTVLWAHEARAKASKDINRIKYLILIEAMSRIDRGNDRNASKPRLRIPLWGSGLPRLNPPLTGFNDSFIPLKLCKIHKYNIL